MQQEVFPLSTCLFCPQLGFQTFTITSVLGDQTATAWERLAPDLLDRLLALTPNGTTIAETVITEVLQGIRGFTGTQHS